MSKTAPDPTVQKLIEEFTNSREFGFLKPATQKVYSSYLRKLEPINARKVGSIKRADLFKIWDKSAASHGAMRSATKVTRRLFSWGMENELITEFPMITMPKTSNRSVPFEAWDSYEIVKYQDAARDYIEIHPERGFVLDAVDIGLATGQRVSDICSMPLDGWSGDTYQVKQQKTGALVRFKPTGRFREILELSRDSGGKFVLQMPEPNHGRLERLRYHFDIVRDTAGVKKTLHGLRKTVAVLLREAGASNAQIAALLGHKTTRMVEAYAAEADQFVLATSAADLMSQINQE